MAYLAIGCHLGMLPRFLEAQDMLNIGLSCVVICGLSVVLVVTHLAQPWFRLADAAPDMLAALQAYEDALSLTGAGTGFEAEIAAAEARFDDLRRVALRKAAGVAGS
jgi:hypothetical protein